MFDELLVQDGVVEEATLARTETGEVSEAWTEVRRIKCLVATSRRPADLPPGVESSVTHVVYARPFPVGGRTLRVVVAGIAYRVVDARDPGARGHHLELLCRREGLQ